MTSELDAFRTGRDRLASLLGTPKDSTEQFVRVAAAGTAGPVPALVNAGGDAIITNGGIRVINGAIEVQNAGATVIIDGTSDMFKIAASGTVSAYWPASYPANSQANVTLSAITASAVPASILMLGWDMSDPSQIRGTGALMTFPLLWGSAFMQAFVSLAGLSLPQPVEVSLYIVTQTGTMGSSTQGGVRFFILQEAGI